MKMSKVPDRWFNYSSIGQVIAGTPFIACKTPLKESIEKEITKRFTPEDLIESVEALGKKLVLVIDLTYTNRYYNADEFNISHVKIFTPGKVVPPPNIVSQFFKEVDSYKKNLGKDDIIAVHCTHGVNRTGYLICKYMIDKLNFDPQKAIEEFNAARGHEIERVNYLHSLKRETINSRTDSVYSSNSREEMAKPYPRQQSYDQNTSSSSQNHQNFNNRYRYQNQQRNFTPPDNCENRSFPSRNNPYPCYLHYYQGPNQWQEYQDYQYDTHHNHSSDHFNSPGSSNYKTPRNKFYGYSNTHSSYRNERREKRERWRK